MWFKMWFTIPFICVCIYGSQAKLPSDSRHCDIKIVILS